MTPSLSAKLEIDFGGKPTEVHFSFEIGTAPQIRSVRQAGQELLDDLTKDEIKDIAARIAQEWKL